jgi:rubrerythrin
MTTAAVELGDQIRSGEAKAEPHTLWKAAENGDDYKHALIHAGFIISNREPWKVCPICGASLENGEP